MQRPYTDDHHRHRANHNTYIPGQSTTVTVDNSTTSALQGLAGTWQVSYSPAQAVWDAGSCKVTVNAQGQVVPSSSSCVSTVSGQSYGLTGGVGADGTFQGTSGSGAVYSGTLNSNTPTDSSGTWVNATTNQNGNWNVTLFTAPAP